jgi:hypothetical protein
VLENTNRLLVINEYLRANRYYEEARVYFDLSFEVINKFLLSLDKAPQHNALNEKDGAALTALLTVLKSAVHNLAGVVHLANDGLVQQTVALNRALYENLMTMRYLTSDDATSRCEQFVASKCLGEKRIIQWAEDEKTPRTFVDPEVLQNRERIEREYREYMQKYFPKRDSVPPSWHGMTMKDFFSKVKKPSVHVHVYPLISGPVHSDAFAARLDPEILANRGARASLATHIMPGELRSQLRMASGLFLECWREYTDVYQPQAGEIIEALENDLIKLAFSDLS